MEFEFEQLAKSWGCPVVARSEVKAFSGGLLNSRTMSNLDSLGHGPEKVYFGNRVAYKTDSLCRWMQERKQKSNKPSLTMS